MERYELSLVSKLDTGLVKATCLFLRWLKTLSLWLLGLATLLFLDEVVFEYEEDLLDISWLEWGVLLLLPLLLWRHAIYCQRFGLEFWRGLSRLLIFQGILCVAMATLFGLLVALILESEFLDSFLRYAAQEDPNSKLVGYGLILLAVYLAAPTSSASRASTPGNFQPIPPAAKEASL